MKLTVYGEVGKDILIVSEDEIHSRYGGAGLYASISAARQGADVEFLTIYNSNKDNYLISMCNILGISLESALMMEDYDLPKYLVTGYKNHEKKISIPMNEIKNDYNYRPFISQDSKGILVFPIGHTIPISLCKEAKSRNIPVFLDPKPNKESIEDAKKALKFVDMLLVNEDEAMLISNTNSTMDAIKVLSNQDLKYLIIKRGEKGCILIEKGKEVIEKLAFKSNAICTLGSGDVFGGALATTFIETGDINYSIEVASCLAADFIERNDPETMLNRAALKNNMSKRKLNENVEFKDISIYLAGPFFSEQEVYWVNYVRKELELRNIKVLSPLHENGIVALNSSYEERKKVYNLDIDLLEDADMVIALLDHDDPGTCFEIGYAVKKNIPVIGLRTSTEYLNNMIYCGCIKVFNSIEEIIEEVKTYATK